jgi:hypothetical protein
MPQYERRLKWDGITTPKGIISHQAPLIFPIFPFYNGILSP